MSANKPLLGFIGLGLMGQGFTKCLVNAGYQVIGYDIKQEKIREANSHGVLSAKSCREVTEASEIVITCFRFIQLYKTIFFSNCKTFFNIPF